MFNNHKLKSNQSLKKYAHTYGTPVFAPDFNATVLKAYLHVLFQRPILHLFLIVFLLQEGTN
jgi:hypothetical protein